MELVLLCALGAGSVWSDSIIEREPSKRPVQPEDTLGGKRTTLKNRMEPC